MPWRTLVSADENMFLELGHENNVQDAAKILRGQKVNFMGLEHGGQPAAAAGLVFQWHDRLITPAERRHMLEAAVWLLNQHDRTIAEHGVATFCHIPHPTLARVMRNRLVERRMQRYREPGTG
jgi:hypothetical protein